MKKGERFKSQERFLWAAEGAGIPQSSFTFLETESILAPFSFFVSPWMQPFHIHSLLLLLPPLPPLHLPLFWQTRLHFCTLSGISILCQTLAESFSICSETGGRGSVPCPLNWQHMTKVLHKQLLVFWRAGAHLTALQLCLSPKK